MESSLSLAPRFKVERFSHIFLAPSQHFCGLYVEVVEFLQKKSKKKKKKAAHPARTSDSTYLQEHHLFNSNNSATVTAPQYGACDHLLPPPPSYSICFDPLRRRDLHTAASWRLRLSSSIRLWAGFPSLIRWNLTPPFDQTARREWVLLFRCHNQRLQRHFSPSFPWHQIYRIIPPMSRRGRLTRHESPPPVCVLQKNREEERLLLWKSSTFCRVAPWWNTDALESLFRYEPQRGAHK